MLQTENLVKEIFPAKVLHLNDFLVCSYKHIVQVEYTKNFSNISTGYKYLYRDKKQDYCFTLCHQEMHKTPYGFTLLVPAFTADRYTQQFTSYIYNFCIMLFLLNFPDCTWRARGSHTYNLCIFSCSCGIIMSHLFCMWVVSFRCIKSLIKDHCLQLFNTCNESLKLFVDHCYGCYLFA